jgi:hypothetical protein
MTLSKDSPFDVRLSSGRESRSYGLIIDRGSLQVSAVAQDDSVYVRNVGKRPGDFDEQRSWKGGRGHEKFNDNSEGFWDSKDAWTRQDGHVHNGILWRFATGLRKATSNFSNSKSWRALKGSQLGISVSFTPDETGDYVTFYCWVRWRGSSVGTNTLTGKLHSDSSGSPGTVLQTLTNSVSSVNGDGVSQLLAVGQADTLTAGTTYHFSLSGASTSNDAGHWEVAVNASGSSSKVSSDLSAWTSPSPAFSMLYRVVDADIDRHFLPFNLEGGFYVVSIYDDDTTASKLYINGERGKATAGASTTLTDTNNGVRSSAWDTDMWAGAWVKINKGKGKGQRRYISSNTGTVLTVSTAWKVNPDTTSEYVIYSTNRWQELTTTGLGVVTGQPMTFGNIVYFPQGTTEIREMTIDYSVATNHKYRSEASNKADFLFLSQDRADGPILWRALNSNKTVSYAKEPAAWATDLTFNTAIKVGDVITGLNEKDSLYVFREKGPGIVTGGAFQIQRSGQEDTPDAANGRASITIDKFLYYSWLHSVVRVFGSSYDDIGQDYAGFGLPNDREGEYAYFDAYVTTLLAAVDALGSEASYARTDGDANGGTSSVLMWDGLNWHELLRGYKAGKRIRMVKVLSCPGTRNQIWTDIGGELIYQEMPFLKKDPLLDPGMLYQHESVIESTIIDMGAASDLPKFIKSLTVTVKNLNAEGMEVYLDYQVDEQCHTNTWTPATVLTESPESTAWLGLNNIRRFAYRLRMNTDDASTPVDIEGVVPTGYARTPLKLMWTMRIKAGGIYQVGSQTSANSQKLWKWLMDNARLPYAVLMESKFDAADGYHVIVHPPRATPYKPAEVGQPEESYFTLTLEEI